MHSPYDNASRVTQTIPAGDTDRSQDLELGLPKIDTGSLDLVCGPTDSNDYVSWKRNLAELHGSTDRANTLRGSGS